VTADGANVVVEAAGAKMGEGAVNNYGAFVVDKLDPGREVWAP